MGLRKYKETDGKIDDGDSNLKETIDFINNSKDADVLIIVQNNNENMDCKIMMHGNWLTLKELSRQYFEMIDNKNLIKEQAKTVLAMLDYLKKEKK